MDCLDLAIRSRDLRERPAGWSGSDVVEVVGEPLLQRPLRAEGGPAGIPAKTLRPLQGKTDRRRGGGRLVCSRKM